MTLSHPSADSSSRYVCHILSAQTRHPPGRCVPMVVVWQNETHVIVVLPTVLALAGDLGVQRGMLRWFVSLHSPSYPVSLRQDKLIDQDTDAVPAGSSADVAAETADGAARQNGLRAATPEASSLPPAPDALATVPSTPKKKGKGKGAEEPVEAGMALPTPFTPSINRTLNMLGKPDGHKAAVNVPPLPEGLTVAQMKARLTGKKIKCVFLDPMFVLLGSNVNCDGVSGALC